MILLLSVALPVRLTFKPVSNDPDYSPCRRGCKEYLSGHRQSSPALMSSSIPITPPSAFRSISRMCPWRTLCVSSSLSGTFYKPVTANTIFVAQNNRTKRTDLDELAVQTFYLTNASQ